MRYLTIYMCFLLTGIIGCTMPQIVQPLHLYDLTDGTTIEVFFHSTSRDHGFISSKDSSSTQFQGEYNFSSDRISGWLPPLRAEAMDKSKTLNQTTPEDFAEAYGFGKNSQARPVGTGIIVGKDGTVIEIVFYRISADLQTGDGIGRDNKGRYYRIFFSTE
jgi:hypothetical protein